MSLNQTMLQKILSDTMSSTLHKGRTSKRGRPRRPRILVLVDRVDYRPENRFGLWRFLHTLSTAPEVTAKPIFTLAHRTIHPTPTINVGSKIYTILNHFNFFTAEKPVTLSNYDHIWIFGISDWAQSLEPAEVRILTEFMQKGGGVFGTGHFDSPNDRVLPYFPGQVR